FNLVTAGSQTITATDGSVSATSSAITVSPSSAVQLQISPATATIVAGSSQTYTATATDYYGNSWDVSTSTVWIIDSGAKGHWSSNVYTSAKSGTWTVTGFYSGMIDQVSLTVDPAASTSITISPKTPSI